jgi:hypothetical protein
MLSSGTVIDDDFRWRRLVALIALLVGASCALWKMNTSFATDGNVIRKHYLVVKDQLEMFDSNLKFDSNRVLLRGSSLNFLDNDRSGKISSRRQNRRR